MNTDLVFHGGNWNTPQTLTVGAAQDSDANSRTVPLRARLVSGDSNYDTCVRAIDLVELTVNDDETAGVTVSDATLTLGVGQPDNTDLYRGQLEQCPDGDGDRCPGR